MKKLKRFITDSKYSKLLIGAAALLLLASFITLFVLAAAPAELEKENVLVSYGQTGKYSYQTYLKPSLIFGSANGTASTNPQFPAAAVSTIDFTYRFTPAGKEPVRASVEAVLENPGIWQKKVTLAPEVRQTGSFRLFFSLDPAAMNRMFDEIEKQLGITASPRTLTLNAVINSGTERLVQSLPLQLEQNLIEISGNLTRSDAAGSGEFDYTVNRKETAAGTGETSSARYPAQIVDKLNFTYKFNSTSTASALATVDVIMENQGVWQKTTRLVHPTVTSGELALLFEVDIDDILRQFEDIDTQTGLTTSPRMVTIRATVDGSRLFVQEIPLTIERGILEVPDNLTLENTAGTGHLTYEVVLLENPIYAESILRPQASSPVPPAPSGLDFSINSKPDSLSGDTSQITIQPGQGIFTRLIDRMEASFSFDFESNKPVENLKTEADIVAVIEAAGIWSRTFPLLHLQESDNFTVDVPLDMAGYIELMEAFRNETGVSPESYDINITANIRTTGETAYGKIDEIFSPTLKGTIKGNILQWDEELTTSRPGSISQTTLVPNTEKYLGMSLGAARGLLIALTVIFLGILLALLYPYYARRQKERISPVEKEVRRIKKKYKMRLIEASDYTPAVGEKIVLLNRIEDLLTVADELGKPVVHAINKNPDEELHNYYVIDGITRYQYLPILSMKEERILRALAERLADRQEEEY